VDQFAISNLAENRDCFWGIRANAGDELAVHVPQQHLSAASKTNVANIKTEPR